MNNIIKSQFFLCKKRLLTLCICVLFPLPYGYLLLSMNPVEEAVPQFAFLTMIFISALPALVLTYSYTERIQMYEIMAGFKPYQLLLGKAVVYLPFAMLSLIGFTIMCLLFDSSAEMIRRMILFWIICFRAVLCIVFLSSFMKESSFAPLFSIMLMIIYSSSDLEVIAGSPISFLCCGQCILLGHEITDSFIIKIIASAVVSSTIYYLIGYFTLKNKFDLEPHKLT